MMQNTTYYTEDMTTSMFSQVLNTSLSNDNSSDNSSTYYGLPRNMQPAYIMAQQVWTYGAPCLIILGTIGNLLSIFVMMRKSLRAHTTSLYLMVLAVVDTTVLYTGLLRYWIRAVANKDVRSFSKGSCKVHIFLVYWLLQFEAWILVCVAVERLFAIFLPFKSKKIFTKRTAVIQMAITGSVLALINTHFFWTYTMVDDAYCRLAHKEYTHFMTNIWSWMDFSLASFVPFIIMLICNAAIIIKLVLLHRDQSNMASANSIKMTSMTAMLLTVIFTFFLTTAPIALFLSTQSRWYGQAKTAADFAELDLVWACVNIVAYLNNSVNFLLYCLSGPRFRRELMRMLHLAKYQIHPANSTQPTATVNIEM